MVEQVSLTAQASLQERDLLKTLRWWDGLAIGFTVPASAFGVLGSVQGASQVPIGQAARLRRLVAVDPSAGAPDPGLQAGPGPVNRVISGAVVVGEFVQPG